MRAGSGSFQITGRPTLEQMPQRAKRPCGKPGCPELTDGRYCSDHIALETQQRREYNQWRGTAASRGYDARCQRVRIQALKRDKYLCLHCLTAGRVTSAVDVDHIIPLPTGPRLDLNNLQSLCRPCHRKKTEEDQRKCGSARRTP
jgi:5-methylcytosine-specific restriction protein A